MFERAKNRQSLRSDERKSDWVFERAHDRKKFHDLSASEWHTRKSFDKICNKDDNGDEFCENIEEV